MSAELKYNGQWYHKYYYTASYLPEALTLFSPIPLIRIDCTPHKQPVLIARTRRFFLEGFVPLSIMDLGFQPSVPDSYLQYTDFSSIHRDVSYQDPRSGNTKKNLFQNVIKYHENNKKKLVLPNKKTIPWSIMRIKLDGGFYRIKKT